MFNVHDFVQTALTQRGKRYIFGAEADGNDPSPSAFDCSELVEWDGKRIGLSPPIPDGAYNQFVMCRNAGLLIPVEEAFGIPGTLLFMGDGTGGGRSAIHHVAISLGDGYTIEARGHAYGVGVFSAHRAFDFAGKIPGIDYRSPSVPTDAAVRQVIKLGDKGKDVLFGQAMYNIIIPAIAKVGYTNGKPLALDGVWGPASASVNQSFEKFWNTEGGGASGKKLQVDGNWTMAGTAPAVANFVKFLLSLK